MVGVVVALAAVALLSITAFAVCSEHHMDGGVVTVEPTCTTIGILTYTCQNEGCDYSYTEKLGNLGHRYINGVCAVCGAAEEGYEGGAASTSEPAADIPAETAPAADKPVAEEILAANPGPAALSDAEKTPVLAVSSAPQTGDPWAADDLDPRPDSFVRCPGPAILGRSQRSF